MPRKRDAALRRSIVIARDVQEDRAARARYHRRVIEPDDDDEIVEMILAPQRLDACAIGALHELVVRRIVWSVAPAIASCDDGNR